MGQLPSPLIRNFGNTLIISLQNNIEYPLEQLSNNNNNMYTYMYNHRTIENQLTNSSTVSVMSILEDCY